MQFKIRAITADEQMIELLLDAINEDHARQQIKERGLFTVSLSAQNSFFKTNRKTGSLSKSKFSLLLFSQELHALLGAGLSIVESLEALLEKEANPATAHILSQLLLGLQEGKRFSQVLAEQPESITHLYVGIVQASERTSNLGISLERYINYQSRVDLIRNKVISALIYPSILLIVGAAVTLFLLAYVVPRFADVYRGTGRQLPWLSQQMLEWGNFASQHGSILLFGFLALVAAAAGAVWQLSKQGGFAELLRKLPGVGDYLRIYHLSRIYLTLGMLLDGGIPIINALTTVSATTNRQLSLALQKASNAIQAGVVLSEAFSQNGLTTPISYRMLRVGERSGELGRMLTQSANFYEGEISRWIDRFIRSFEPILMTVIGLVVGVIVVLLYMPIFDLADGLG